MITRHLLVVATVLGLGAALSVPVALGELGGAATAAHARSHPPELFTAAPAAALRQDADASQGRVRRSRFVSFRADLLPSVARHQELALSFFSDARFTGTVDHVDRQPLLTSWSGPLDTQFGSFVATRAGDIYSVTANTLHGTFTMTRTLSGLYQVAEVAAPPVPTGDDVTTVAVTGGTSSGGSGPAAGRAGQRDATARRHRVVRGGDDGSVEDILVVYTAAAAAAYGGDAGIAAEAAKNVGYANAAYASSGVRTTARLVAVLPVSGTEAGGDLAADLAHFAKRGDGRFDEVFKDVKKTHADDAMLLERPFIDSDTVCGRAYEERNQPVEFAFGVVFTGDCTNGFTTFPHELGHNQGASHDYYTATTPGAGYADGAKPQYPYGYGYVAPDFAFRTIMGYPRACTEVGGHYCTYIFDFANPAVVYGGQATGEPTHSDVAKLITKTRKSMARHQQSTLYVRGAVHITPAPVLGRGPVHADYRWINGGVHTTFHWYRNGERIKHANHRYYRPTRKDVGKKLTVVITGKKRFYAPVAAGSGNRKVKGPHRHHHHHRASSRQANPVANALGLPDLRSSTWF